MKATHDISLIRAIEKFEDCLIPLFNYTSKTDFQDIHLLKHYVSKLAKECDWMKSVFENALDRLEEPERQNEFKAILDMMEAKK